MKLPEINEPNKYIGLYVVDFGDHCAVGFTAAEVAELLESEEHADVQVYKVHRANPDGTMELKGISHQTFQLEAGMFFHASDQSTAESDYQRLLAWADEQLPPARCKVHLSQVDDAFITAMIYPAEFDDAFSRWLLDADYKTEGPVEAGTTAVQRYYDMATEVLQRQQLWPAESIESMTGRVLLEATNQAIVR